MTRSIVVIAFFVVLLFGGFLIFKLNADTIWQLNTEITKTRRPASNWVYPNADGKLVYKKTKAGDRVLDFSHAGYMGGGIALPDVPVKVTLHPTGTKDDTDLIQAAIEEVASLPLTHGHRGTVFLAPGTFICKKPIVLSASGIVLRGSGTGDEGTTIKMEGADHAAIEIGSIKNRQELPGSPEAFSKAETWIIDMYVPSGASVFSIADATEYSVGDTIEITKPVTKAWIEHMEMDNLNRDGKPQTWISTSRSLKMIRKIVAISGNKISVDIPVSDSFDAKYLGTKGTKVSKVRLPSRVRQVGIEHLNFQCPPLEIAYGSAPYSGIRINGDDCWVKDVFFEETMNTTTLRGNRITMQDVVVTHTYPNLGASKPADFSIEGSQNLLDRCKSSGGNTYFVWTGSLVSGPNVLLNCTFRGHGSRIQPHQRWSTGMLVDNCTIADGGIDFMNRGVAGSGHGWTMGWGVVWNSIAKTYIIQNPPDVLNWAIGCQGDRMHTARLFDTHPVLEEGVFDSHGVPVTPQSLYLAQLAERLGKDALKNIGYPDNTETQFHNKSVAPLPPLKTETDPVLGPDLALHRPINANNVYGNLREFGGEKVVDADEKTYWTVDSFVNTPSLTLDTEGPLEINALSISEEKGKVNRVQKYKIEGQVDSRWILLAEGTTIGRLKIEKFPNITVWKTRLTILKSNGSPAISKFSLYQHDDKAQPEQSVSSLSELQKTAYKARPGDEIVLADGTYNSSSPIMINCQGTADKPIIIRAKSIGGAIITGEAGFIIEKPARFIIIKGFVFKHATDPGNRIKFGADHCRFTQNIFEQTGTGSYLIVSGDDAEVDYNTFQNKSTEGRMILVEGPGGETMAQNTWIHHNFFNNFKNSGFNNSSAIQFGRSWSSLTPAHGLVEYNLFINCHGENENVAHKASDCVYRFNTFGPGSSELSLRHGNHNEVYGNFFLNTEGIRIFGDDHKIYSNYFEGNSRAVHIGNGDGEVADGSKLTAHDRPDRCEIVYNTLVDNAQNFYMGGRKNGLGATNITIAMNIVQGGGKIAEIHGANLNAEWTGNIAWRTLGAGDIPPTGYQSINPRLFKNDSIIYHLAADSPVIDAGSDSYPYVKLDMDGQKRISKPDMGADEYMNSTQINKPLTIEKVGPNSASFDGDK